MKVRILNNSIRFRISMDEMEMLWKGGSIHSVTQFFSEDLIVQVKIQKAEENIDLSNNKIRLNLLPETITALHSDATKVGHSFQQNDLQVLFEKDFQCLTERGEDESRLYENPRTKHI